MKVKKTNGKAESHLSEKGVDLGALFVLEQFQHPMSQVNKLLVLKSIKAGKDLVFDFCQVYLQSVSGQDEQ